MLYDYKCKDCSYVKEVLVNSSEDGKYEAEFCPKCKGLMIRQFPLSTYLPETSELHTRIHKAEKTMGTGDLEKHQLPRNSSVPMWPSK